MISHKFSINEIAKNYLKFITNPNEYLGIIISYNSKTLSRKIEDNSKIKNRIFGLYKKYGWKAVAGIFLYYLVRDVSLYIVLPYLIAKKIIFN